MASNDISSVPVVDWTVFEKDLNEVVDDIDKSEKRRQKLDKTEDKTLINSIKIKTNKLIENIVFDSIERVSHFWIDGHNNYNTSKGLPKLNLPENCRKMDLDLEEGFDDCFKNDGLIQDYYQYRDKKWEHFLQTIKDNDLLDKYKPQFVSFGGPIADILATVYDTSIEWKMTAQKTNDVIYFFKTRNERLQNEYFSNRSQRRSYCGLKFLHLITDRDDNQLNEFEKCFAINCIEFGLHKILSLNELDAIDDSINRCVDIKLIQKICSAKDQEFFEKKKLLRFWSKAAVQGIERIVIGNMNSNHYLEDIEERKVETIPDLCAHKWSHIHCMGFLNRFFTFMKECMTEENIIYEFHFKSGEDFVVCNRFNPERRTPIILPQFYTQSKN